MHFSFWAIFALFSSSNLRWSYLLFFPVRQGWLYTCTRIHVNLAILCGNFPVWQSPGPAQFSEKYSVISSWFVSLLRSQAITALNGKTVNGPKFPLMLLYFMPYNGRGYPRLAFTSLWQSTECLQAGTSIPGGEEVPWLWGLRRDSGNGTLHRLDVSTLASLNFQFFRFFWILHF